MTQGISISGVVLAAGKGLRMQSSIPKVLHEIAGKTMLEYVLETLRCTGVQKICVVLNTDLQPFLGFMERNKDVVICVQRIQNGTGGAAAAALPAFSGFRELSYAPSFRERGESFLATHVLVCFGDTPALKAEVLQAFMKNCLHSQSALGILGMELDDPTGYGRMLTNATGTLDAIIEEKDADEDTRKIKVCNSGVIFAETSFLFSLLARLSPNNSQSEYYITDCVRLAAELGRPASLFVTKEWKCFVGVNNPQQLAAVQDFLGNKADEMPA